MPERDVCPVHGLPDCSPILNGCSRLTSLERCGSCRWWGAEDELPSLPSLPVMPSPGVSREAHEEAAHAVESHYRLCRRILLGGQAYDGPPPDWINAPPLAYTQDGSGYRADLFTRSEFGCVDHEPVVRDEDGWVVRVEGGTTYAVPRAALEGDPPPVPSSEWPEGWTDLGCTTES